MPKVALPLVLITALLAFAPVNAHAANTNNALTVPIVGSVNANNAVYNLAGTLNLTGFTFQNGQVLATGTATGTVTNTVTGVVTSFVQTVTAILDTAHSSGSCTILHLVLGPISIDVLGLVITTNQIVIDISAQAAPNNLLGNLLCEVAGLLNNPSQTLANLLNQIITILRNL